MLFCAHQRENAEKSEYNIIIYKIWKEVLLTELLLSVYTKYNKYVLSDTIVWYKTELQEVLS